MANTTTFLTMCQSVRQNAQIGGAGPSSVTNQTDALKDVVDFTRKAWVDIQKMRKGWLFNWKTFEFNATSGKNNYLAEVPDLKRWGTDAEEKPITEYLLSEGVAGEVPMENMTYAEFRETYLRGTPQTNRPHNYAIAPDNTLYLGPTPNGTFVIKGEYYKTTQVLTANADIIELDDDYVDVILWRAVRSYAKQIQDPNMVETATDDYNEQLVQLCSRYLPALTFGAPIA